MRSVDDSSDSIATVIKSGAPSVDGNEFVYMISTENYMVPTQNVKNILVVWTYIENDEAINAANGTNIGVAEVDG